MSKSKGNVVVPNDLLDEYWIRRGQVLGGIARLGNDPAVDHSVYREGKRLITKIKNATRFVTASKPLGGPTSL